MECWINVFKLHAALHPEGVGQVGIFNPCAENTAVAGEDVGRISTSGMGLFGKWGCHFVYRAEVTTGECHLWGQADMTLRDKQPWRLGTSQLVSCSVLLCGYRECPRTLSTPWTSCAACPLSICMNWEEFFCLVKVVLSNQSPPTTSQVVLPIPSFLLSFCVSKQLLEGHQEGLWGPLQALCGDPKRSCLALNLSGQTLYAEAEGLFR